MRCAHCLHTRRDVSLWNQIIGLAHGTVCCFIPWLERR